MFDHKKWIKTFESDPGYNDAISHGVKVVRNDLPWNVIGVHHLSPEENSMNHHIYIDCLNEKGRRVKSEKINWEWEGKRLDQRADPVQMDKPVNEVPNLPIWAGQKIDIWHPDGETVTGLRANHPDEKKGNGELGNSIGHHSFFVVFQKNGVLDVPDIPEPMPHPEQMPTDYKVVAPPGNSVTEHQNFLKEEAKWGWLTYAAVLLNNRMHYFMRK